MLTQEQIKNLQPGDPIVIHTLFDHSDGDGDIRVRTPSKIGGSNIAYIHPNCVSLPSDSQSSTVNSQPKHDPCRLFRKGDKVRVVEWNGRNYSGVENGKCGTVIRNEAWMTIAVNFSGDRDWEIEPCYLELVTPVEELEPYEVTERSDYYGVDKDDLEVEAAIFWKKAHPHAKAAAEAECARLNAEWRKKHGNA